MLRWIFLISFTYATERLWLIRHCDKVDDSNPCCASIGYERALYWSKYLSDKLPINENLYFIQPGESSYKKCLISNNFNTTRDSKCQKSERLTITMEIIRSNIGHESLLSDKYCVKNTDALIKKELKNNPNTDVVLVWEHTEIVEIINKLGFHLGAWPHGNQYNIIFLIDFTKNQLYYDVVKLISDTKDFDISQWIKKYKSMPEFIHDHVNNENAYVMHYLALKAISFFVALMWCIVKYYSPRKEYLSI